MKSPIRLSILFILVIASIAGCAEEAKPDGNDLGSGLDLPPPIETPGILPAYQTDMELDEEGKADYLAVTASYDDIYGLTGSPASGSRATPEWEPSDGVLVAWESGMDNFFYSLVASLEPAVPVYIMTPSVSFSADLGSYLSSYGVNTSRVFFFEYEHESFWTRDYGPVSVELPDGSAGFIDTQYYSYRRRDDAVPTLMGHYFDVPVYRPSLATEGGNFMTNGEGLCVMTEWLLDENPYLTNSDVEDTMATYYGCEQTVVLERMYGEGTGHVDMFAKFTQTDVVLVGYYEDFDQPQNAAILDRNAETLAGLRLSNGGSLRVVRIPMPEPEHPMYASFTNSLIVNDTVVMPTYSWARHLEDEAIASYRDALPAGFDIETVDSSEMIYYGGAVHCTTMAFSSAATVESTTTTTTPTNLTSGARYEVEPAVPIRDNRTIESTITVSDDAVSSAGSLEIDVDIAHTYVGDLTISLVHDGYELQLYRGSGSSDDVVTTFSTNEFNGNSVGGGWTLRVTDSASQDEGTLRSWAIEFL